jgi:gamma-glutamylcyclotransferase (GGCT)/AIG2-like uncharacterized protein YtfP
MKNKRLYIAYGSNLNVHQMAMRCSTAKIVGTVELQNYELQFKGYPTSAFATINYCKGSTVPVLVWELSKKDEKALDIYEGYPSHYYKQDVRVNIGDTQNTAMVYIMGPNQNFGIPTHRYYNTVLEGYDKAGFDVNILNDAINKSIVEYHNLEAKQTNLFDYDDQQNHYEAKEELCDEDEIEIDDDWSFDNQLHL